MDQKPDVIKHHIEQQREVLGENLNYLEHRVRAMADWRTWVDHKPLLVAAVAFGAGLALAIGTRK